MAKQSKKNSSFSKFTKTVSPTKAFAILFVALFAIIGATYVFASSAAAPLPKGTLAVNSSSNLTYGGKVVFDVTYKGKVSQKAQIQVSMVCYDANGTTVLQGTIPVYSWYSTTNLQPSADLVGNAALPWNGQEASCTAGLVYRADSTKNITIEPIAPPVTFNVAAAN